MAVQPATVVALVTVAGGLLLAVALTQASPLQDLLQDLDDYDYSEEDFDATGEEKVSDCCSEAL